MRTDDDIRRDVEFELEWEPDINAKNVAVKVPLTWDGLKACRALTQKGHMVNVTLCFTAAQALPPSTFARRSAFATGVAGDVFVCHPFLVHRATWPHRGQVGRGGAEAPGDHLHP